MDAVQYVSFCSLPYGFASCSCVFSRVISLG
jgi:hypothetical protein